MQSIQQIYHICCIQPFTDPAIGKVLNERFFPYYNLLIAETFNTNLAEAGHMLQFLMKLLAKQENIPEKLKVIAPMKGCRK